MDRPLRAFRPVASPLEGRLLLTSLHALPPAPAPSITPAPAFTITPRASFVGAGSDIFSLMPSVNYSKIVPQGASTATIFVQAYGGSPSSGPVTVRVTTDPSSPAVGVNVGAIDQTVTFDVQSRVAVNVPIIAGAPNPGVVNVRLYLTPVEPTDTGIDGSPFNLSIWATNPAGPPRVLTASTIPQGLAVTFSKPMNPIGASNVRNYAVHRMTSIPTSGFLGTTELVPLKSATYDPATYTVTLVPKQRLLQRRYDVFSSSEVTQGAGASGSARTRHGAGAAQGLTDLDGRRIGNQKIPGKFQVVTD